MVPDRDVLALFPPHLETESLVERTKMKERLEHRLMHMPRRCHHSLMTLYYYDNSVFIKISEKFGIPSTQVIHLLNLENSRLNVVRIQPKYFLFLHFYRTDRD